MKFPGYRNRRVRSSAGIRRLVRESYISTDKLIYPIFIRYGKDVHDPISSIPGSYKISIDKIKSEVKELSSLDIPAVILFGIPDPSKKDKSGSEAYRKDGIVQSAIKEFKSCNPALTVITDVCIDEYTDHGHCGLVEEDKILNDETLDLLSQMALTHADSGADIVAPSDMMDGRVKAIRETLDANNFSDTAIMAYSAKYSSGFYGPFRDACDSAPSFGDRSTYQMDPANAREALREVKLDIDENSDIVMVKPALSYLDIIRLIRDRYSIPIAAYNVSGEVAMVEAAADRGWIDRDRVMMEILVSIIRSGADMILTYYAKRAAAILNG